MIERLSGRCVLKQMGAVIVDVSGVGYGVELAERALSQIDEGQELVLWIHTHVREDQLKLFGFLTHAERVLFQALLGVNDIGPKVAMAVMNTLTINQLLTAVELEDAGPLEEVPGIGKSKSKRILLELKPKLAKLSALGLLAGNHAGPASKNRGPGALSLFAEASRLAPSVVADLKSALENFGYKDKELAPLLKRFEREPPAQGLAELIRHALAEINGTLKTEGARRSAEELF